jgi:hypothetical protein
VEEIEGYYNHTVRSRIQACIHTRVEPFAQKVESCYLRNNEIFSFSEYKLVLREIQLLERRGLEGMKQ